MRHVVVMGVSGCGKSTVGVALAVRTGFEFADADEFHPPANIERMSRGYALTDDDRYGWLQSLAHWLAAKEAAGASTVLACSALKRAYRDLLRASGVGTLDFVELDVSPEALRARMANRDHFMPTSLLDSQLATLEPLSDDERGIRLDAAEPVENLVTQIIDRLDLPTSDAATGR